MTHQFNLTKFEHNMHNPDPDFTITELAELNKRLEEDSNITKHFNNNKLDLSNEDIKDKFIPNAVNAIKHQHPDVVNFAFRLIVLLSEHLPIQTLSTFFDKIYSNIDPECDIRNQILSVLREVLSNSVNYPEDRQKKIVKFFIEKLNKNANLEILIFNIDLLTSLTENLGFLFTKEDLDKVKNLIFEYSKDKRLDVLPSVASLAKFWMVVALPDQFDEMMVFLYELSEDVQEGKNVNAFTILSSMVCYKPNIYQKECQRLIKLFLDRIIQEQDRMSQQMDADNFSDAQYVQHISEALSSLTSLVKEFPDQCDDDMVSNSISVLFYYQYLTYCLSAVPEHENADENQNENEDDGFEMEADDQAQLDEVDEVIVTGDDSWKIRKAAIAFAIVLIQCFTNEFYETLSYQSEDIDYLSVVNILLNDTDSGAQKDAFGFLETVIHYYKELLLEDDVNVWYKTLLSYLTKGFQSNSILVIETLTYVISEYHKIPIEILIHIMDSIYHMLNNTTLSSSLNFVSTVLNSVDKCTQIVNDSALILNVIIEKLNASSSIPCLPVCSELFEYSRDIQLDISHDEETTNNLFELVNTIMNTCKSDSNERVLQAYTTLGVFCASFSDFNIEHVIELIIESFVEGIAMKQVCGSISLIAASPSGPIKLAPFVSQIYHKLCSIFTDSESCIDGTYLFRYLWCLRILLEKGLIDVQSVGNLSDHLTDIICTSNVKNQLLAIHILKLTPEYACQSLEKIKSASFSPLSEEVVSAIASLLDVCATTSLMPIKEFINDLIATTNSHLNEASQSTHSNDDVSQNIALIVGLVAGNHEVIRNEILEGFQTIIIEKTNLAELPFIINCIGEIGALIDLSDHVDMINCIFELVNHPEREIFSAASECIGLLSIGSNTAILNRFLAEALKPESNSSVWILAVLSLTKRLSKLNGSIDMQPFKTISSFLLANSDYSQPTARTISQCFEYMINISKGDYVPQLLADEQLTREKVIPVVMHGVSIFYEESSQNENYQLCLKFIDQIMSLFNIQNPRIDEFIINSLKLSFQIVLQKNQSLQFDFDLYKYIPIVLEATKYIQESHLFVEEIGLNQHRETDIGKQQRLNALDCLSIAFKLNYQRCDLVQIVECACVSMCKDPNEEVRAHACSLLNTITMNNQVSNELCEIIQTKQAEFEEAEKNAFITSSTRIEFLEDAFLKLIVSLRRITDRRKINFIEKIYANKKDDPRIKKFESDFSYKANDISASSSNLTTGSVSISLMTVFYPEAAVIFTI